MIVVGLRHERGLANAPHDAKLAFLKGELQDDVYVKHPAWFVLKGRADKELHLIKALYGLRQPHRAWYSKLDASLKRGVPLSILCICEVREHDVPLWEYTSTT